MMKQQYFCSLHAYILLFFLMMHLHVHNVHAGGPGLHRYQESHSNYGDEKKAKEHVEEHIKSMTDKEDIELSEDDIVYYMFVLHDTNGDGYLDGNELREAFIDYGKDHQHDEGERKQKNIDKDVAFTLEDVTAMVDHILEEDDKNGDGLISWSEYLESRLYHTEA